MLILFWRAQHDHLNISKHNHLFLSLYNFKYTFFLGEELYDMAKHPKHGKGVWVSFLFEWVKEWLCECDYFVFYPSLHIRTLRNFFVCAKRDTFICGRMYAMVFDLIMLLMPVLRSILFLWIIFYTFECEIGIKIFSKNEWFVKSN